MSGTTLAPDTLSDADLDALVRALADEPEVPCEFDRDGVACPNAARWAVRCARCGTDVHACDRCRVLVDHLQHTGYTVSCIVGTTGMCGEFYPSPMPWRPL